MAALAAIDLDVARPARNVTMGQRYERAGIVVVHPDRADAWPGLEDAWHLTARQLPTLAVRPIGWDPTQAQSPAETAEASAGEAAA